MKKCFLINDKPKALKRYRFYQKGGYKGTYDPSSEEKKVFLSLCKCHAPDVPISKGIELTLEFCFERPKSQFVSSNRSKPLKKNSTKEHLKKPDLDNLVKFVCDALNKVFWEDDCYINIIHASKIYGEKSYTSVGINY